MKSFWFAWFLGFVFLLLASLFAANAAPANAKEKPKATMTEKKISFDTGKKDKAGKKIVREFPVMFDIAKRSQDKRAQKQKKGADKK